MKDLSLGVLGVFQATITGAEGRKQREDSKEMGQRGTESGWVAQPCESVLEH